MRPYVGPGAIHPLVTEELPWLVNLVPLRHWVRENEHYPMFVRRMGAGFVNDVAGVGFGVFPTFACGGGGEILGKFGRLSWREVFSELLEAPSGVGEIKFFVILIKESDARAISFRVFKSPRDETLLGLLSRTLEEFKQIQRAKLTKILSD